MSSVSFHRFYKGIVLRGETTDPIDNIEGSVFHNSSDSRIRTYIQGSLRDLTTNSQVQTLTNKTLTSPVITGPTGITKSDVGLGNVDNTSDATKNSATATLTNKTFTSPVINSPTGIVKGDVGLGNVDNTSDATKNAASATLTNKILSGNTASGLINGSGAINFNSTGTITVPNATDTLVGKATTDTLTNKSIDAATNTLINILNASIGAAAAIARTKLANGTASHVLINDGSGVMSSEATLAVSRGGTNSGTALNNNRIMKSSSGTIIEAAAITASRALISDANGIPTHSTTTSTELGYVSGATSSLQDQINTISGGFAGFNPVQPSVTALTSTGTSVYNLKYAFSISSGSATAGATYTNNAVTFTVYATIASATLVYMSGSGAPASSGTLTKASGTGDATLSFTAFVAPKRLHIRMVGGGGGGSAGGETAPTQGTAGGDTIFSNFGGSNILIAGSGGGGFWANVGPFGGAVTVNSPAIQVAAVVGGSASGTGFWGGSSNASGAGGGGGSSAFGGGAGGGASGDVASSAGKAAPANSGAGGGGGGVSSSSNNHYVGSGGGAGGYIEALIINPATRYDYNVGSGGAGGSPASTSGGIGGDGGSGQIIVMEYYF